MKSDVIQLGALSGEVGRPARVLWESLRIEDDGRVLFPVYGNTEEDVPCYFTSEVLTWLAWRVGADVPDRSDEPAVRSILTALAAIEASATVRFARSAGEHVIEVAQVEFGIAAPSLRRTTSIDEGRRLMCDYLDASDAYQSELHASATGGRQRFGAGPTKSMAALRAKAESTRRALDIWLGREPRSES